jgi:enamine deaminase RidA (YjgF/YER057c/UK114 family)
MVRASDSQSIGVEQRLKELGIKLPAPPEPFGTYVEAVQTGNLLFLSGMLPTAGREAKIIGRVGAELDVEAGRKAAHRDRWSRVGDIEQKVKQVQEHYVDAPQIAKVGPPPETSP